jgi:hypothetical protein
MPGYRYPVFGIDRYSWHSSGTVKYYQFQNWTAPQDRVAIAGHDTNHPPRRTRENLGFKTQES